MKSSVAIQCGSARIKHKTDIPCTNHGPSTSNASCKSQECPFKSRPREYGDENPPQVKKRTFWQFVGQNLEPLPFAITRDNKKKEVEAWSRIYPINNNNKQPLITFLSMFRQLATAERPKDNSKVGDADKKHFGVLHKTEYEKVQNDIPHDASRIEAMNEKKANDVTPMLDKGPDEREGIIPNKNYLEIPNEMQKTKDVTAAREDIGIPHLQHPKTTDKHTPKYGPKVVPVKAEHETFKHCFSDKNEELSVEHKISELQAKPSKDTAVSTDEELRSLGSISNDTATTNTAASVKSKSRLVKHSVQQINIYSDSKKTNSYLPVPKKFSDKNGGFDKKSNKKGAVNEYRVGSPGPAISRTGLFCVVPQVARLRPLDSSFRSYNCRTAAGVFKKNKPEN